MRFLIKASLLVTIVTIVAVSLCASPARGASLSSADAPLFSWSLPPPLQRIASFLKSFTDAFNDGLASIATALIPNSIYTTQQNKQPINPAANQSVKPTADSLNPTTNNTTPAQAPAGTPTSGERSKEIDISSLASSPSSPLRLREIITTVPAPPDPALLAILTVTREELQATQRNFTLVKSSLGTITSDIEALADELTALKAQTLAASASPAIREVIRETVVQVATPPGASLGNKEITASLESGAIAPTTITIGSMTLGGATLASIQTINSSPTITGTLTISGTGTSTLASSLQIASYLTSGGLLTIPSFAATSTTATSTIAGGLAIETSGFVYDYSSNNTGIGTDAPLARLNVNATGGDTIGKDQVLALGGTGGRQTWGFRISTSTGDLHVERALGGVINVVATFARNNTALGIGTTNPLQKLHVVGNQITTGDHFIYGGDINLGTGSATSTLTSSSGNLGLATTSPGSPLSVQGVANFAPTNSFLYSQLTLPSFTATSTTATSTISGGLTTAGLASSNGLTLSGGIFNSGVTATSSFAGGLALTSLSASNGLTVTGGNIVHTGASFVVQNSGNVGIGTTSPGSILSVQGVGNFAPSVSQFYPTIQLPIFTATSTTATSTIAGGLAIETSGFVYDYSSNRIGIGTAAPQSFLHIRADSNKEIQLGTLPSSGGPSDVTTYGSGLAFTRPNTGAFVYSIFPYVASNGDENLYFTTRSDFVFGSNDSEIFRIGVNEAGAGTAGARLSLGRRGGSASRFQFMVGDGQDTTTTDEGYLRYNNTAFHFQQDTDEILTLAYGSGVAAGNVGIKDTSPDATLEVTGTFMVSATAAGDGNRLTVNSSGSLGLATTSPGSLLSVQGNSLTSGTSTVGSLIATSTLYIGNSGSRLLVNEAGNVGIGTTGPTRNLTVQGTNAYILATSNDGTGNAFSIFENSVDANNAWALGRLDTGSFAILHTAGATYSGNTQRLSIDTSGNVGIGEVAPGAKLSVSGGATIGASYDTTAAPSNGLLIEGNLGLGTTSPVALLSVSGASALASSVSVGASYAGTAPPANGMIIAGNVGVGITTPLAPLHVVNNNAGFSATGGTITTSGGYTIHTFTSGGTFTPNGANNVEVLVIAGGGGGGGFGGGGAGGYVYSASSAVTAQAYTVTVGGGGVVSGSGSLRGANGSNSVFNTLTAAGGGGGGAFSNSIPTGLDGGSGGGGGTDSTDLFTGRAGGNGNTPSVSPSQGNNGGNGLTGGTAGGGGGGAGGAGGTPIGGVGTANSISGSSITYAAGGAGGAGGGAGSGSSGAGGGGGGGYNGGGTNGASGIVIIRYPTPAGATGAIFANSVVIGATSAAAKLQSLSVTEQLRLSYDTSNYNSFTVGSTGNLTIAAAGTNPNITLTPEGTGYTLLNGNVGLATTSPGSLLSVQGVANFAPSNSFLYSQLTLPSFTATSTTATSTVAGGLSTAGLASSNGLTLTGGILRSTVTATSTLDGGLAITAGGLRLSTLTAGSVLFAGASGALQENNANLFWDNTNGRLGVGTTSPGSILSVHGNALISGTSTVGSLIATSTLYVGNSGSRFIVNEAGNVGIGTTGPGAKLDVAGGIRSITISILGTGSSDDPDRLFNMNQTANNTAANILLTGRNSGGTDQHVLFGASQDAKFHIYTPGVYQTSGAKALTIVGTGNVGIGETAPGSKLSVSGGATIGASYDTTAAPSNGLIIEGSLGIGTTTPGSLLSVQGVANFAPSNSFLYSQFTLPSFTATSTTATSTIAGGLAIETSGFVYDYTSNRVGIGTAVPLYKLEVNGDINVPSGSQYKINGVNQAFDKWTAGTGDDIYRSTGNLGIGTTSPCCVLSVRGIDGSGQGGAAPQAVLLVGGTGAANTGAGAVGGAGGILRLVSGTGGTATNVGRGGTGGDVILAAGDGGEGVSTAFSGLGGGFGGNVVINPGVKGPGSGGVGTAGNITLATVGGNVGVATTSPYQLFSVHGSAVLGSANSDALTIRAGAWTLNSTATNTVTMINGINFDSGTLVIDPNANYVGIGTTSPCCVLSVRGIDGSGQGGAAPQAVLLVGGTGAANTGAGAVGGCRRDLAPCKRNRGNSDECWKRGYWRRRHSSCG